MAEFCPECWKKMNENDDMKNYILFVEAELCEGCGEMKKVIAVGRKGRSRKNSRVWSICETVHRIARFFDKFYRWGMPMATAGN